VVRIRPPICFLGRGATARARVIKHYKAIWRLISPGSRFLRVGRHIFTAPPVHDRKIVAELAGKVEILFDQHDRDVAEVAQVKRFARPMSLMIEG